MIQRLREYWAEFAAGVATAWRELREERNYLGLAVLLVCLPLLAVASVLAWLGDIGPD